MEKSPNDAAGRASAEEVVFSCDWGGGVGAAGTSVSPPTRESARCAAAHQIAVAVNVVDATDARPELEPA